MRLFMIALALSMPAIGLAQESDLGLAVHHTRPAPSGDEPDDADLIRWAAREVSTAPHTPIPPPPPDSYISPTREDRALRFTDNPDRDLERIAAEIGGGALGIAVGGGIGTLLLWATTQGGGVAPQLVMLVAGAGGSLAALGVTCGVVLAADLFGGRGNFAYAFIGQALGALGAVPLVVSAIDRGDPWLGLVPVGVLPLVGAIVAYELAHVANQAGGGPVASIAPMPGGAIANVAGVF